MHDFSVLKDLMVIMAVVIPLVLFAQRLNFPSIIGFIVGGIIIGPNALGWVKETGSVEILAEVGIVLLLFTIGLEYSIEKLLKLRNFLLITGGTQVLFTILVTWGITAFFEVPTNKAIILGFMVSLSSTAIIMKILGQRKELTTTTGMLTLSIALFQDLCIIPMMLFLPILGSSQSLSLLDITSTLAFSGTGIVVIIVGARILVPQMLKIILEMNNREVFLISVIFIIFGIAYIATTLGLSIALGAFLAGLIISESEYSHQILADVFPFRDALTSLFFVSIGMLLNFYFFKENYVLILGISFLIIFFKTAIVAGTSYFLNYPFRLGIAVGLIIAQIGEFSFVIALSAYSMGVISDFDYQVFLGASIITMLISPFLINQANPIGFYIQKKFKISGLVTNPLRKVSDLVKTEELKNDESIKSLKKHVIIIGYGKTGQHLSYVLKDIGIPFIISEMQIRRFHDAKDAGYKIIFGDAATQEILEQLHVETASVLVIGTGDLASTTRICQLARQLNSTIHVIARTRYIDNLESLMTAGANEVIPEEYETSIEIFSRTLRHYHIPRNIIATQISIIRKEKYGTLRGLATSKDTLEQLPYLLAATATESVVILDHSPIKGKSIKESDLSSKCRVHIIALVRNNEAQTNPPDDMVLEAGDVLIIIGSHAEIDAAILLVGNEQ